MSFLLPPLPPTFEAALRDVHARGVPARVAAAERLAATEPDALDRAIEGLLVLAADVDARVRAAALRAIKDIGPPAAPLALDGLLARLDDRDALVRELAVVALGAIGSERAHNVLRRALRSAHPEVRFQAVASLAEAGDASDTPALTAMLRDADPKVRANTARSLSRLGAADSATAPALRGGASAHADLRALLSDTDSDVRIEAALTLARAGDASGADALRAAIDDTEYALEALDAVAALGLAELREPIALLAQSVLKSRTLKVAAARALCRLHDPRGIDALRDVLRAFRSDGRSYAVQVVGELAIHELAGELLRLAHRQRGVDPAVLVDALAALLPDSTPARAGLTLLSRRNDQAGEHARQALG
jgi:HEAT repeat protein